jgi:hypothetical protein
MLEPESEPAGGEPTRPRRPSREPAPGSESHDDPGAADLPDERHGRSWPGTQHVDPASTELDRDLSEHRPTRGWEP